MNCPLCGRKLRTKNYYDDRGIVETIEECTYCGKYANNSVYGTQILKIGNWSRDFTDHAYMTDKDDIKTAELAWKEFYLRLRYYSNRRRKKGKKRSR